MSPRSSNRGVCSIGPIGLHLVEDLFAFHQRKGEERDFPQGNAEGRDSGARESWLEDERASWVICVSVGRLDFFVQHCVSHMLSGGQRSLWGFW